MESILIRSWLELAQLLELHADGTWLFRGESTDGDPLKPAAGRVGREIGSARKKPYEKAHEIEALEQFKREARPHLTHLPENDLEWLAIAQHHGMATRLLDWSESLLVAAFFAVINAGARNRAGVIYAVNEIQAVSKDDAEEPFEMSDVRLYRPPHITSRITAQRGVLTVHPDPTQEYCPPSMQKWTVEPAACGRIKHILSACAIDEGSLFPGVDGLSRHIRWRYKWAKFHVGDEV
jgi:FRG domain-containing protein